MTIGIEAERANHPQKTGVEHYAQQLILHLANIDRQNSYVLYLRTTPQDWFFSLPENFKTKVLGYGPFPFPYLWTQLRLSWEMLIAPPHVLFVPAASLPIIHPQSSYVTVHDIAWRLYPQTFKLLKRWYLEFTTWFACRFATGIIAVSQATKKDLVKFYRVDASKVQVVYHGFSLQEASHASHQTDQDRIQNNLGHTPFSDSPYILFVSTLQPRKNLEGLIQAFRELKKDMPELPQQLVVIGKPGWKFQRILEIIQVNSDIVHYWGHVSEEQKAFIFSGADLLVVPSFYEGFGMQILEAFAAGVPVATSNVSSMPEVAGEAAVYFDPHIVQDIKIAIQSVLLDKALADRLRQKGKERLNKFSWDTCAKETLAVLMGKPA